MFGASWSFANTSTSSSETKPEKPGCPYQGCKGPLQAIERPAGYAVYCDGCGCRGPISATEAEAWERWGKRC